MVIVFRVDASTQIGTGHVIRCLTLSNVLRARGAKCYFICRSHEGNLIKKILQDGFEVIDLQTKARPCGNKRAEKKLLAHADWLGAEWQLDAEQTIVFLKDISPDWLIVDHYALDQHWESAMRPYCSRVMVIMTVTYCWIRISLRICFVAMKSIFRNTLGFFLGQNMPCCSQSILSFVRGPHHAPV